MLLRRVCNKRVAEEFEYPFFFVDKLENVVEFEEIKVTLLLSRCKSLDNIETLMRVRDMNSQNSYLFELKKAPIKNSLLLRKTSFSEIQLFLLKQP